MIEEFEFYSSEGHEGIRLPDWEVVYDGVTVG
jgi:hypothetical protein